MSTVVRSLGCAVVFVFGLAFGAATNGNLPPQTVLNKADASLKRDPQNPRLWAVRGIALSELGRDHEAMDSFEKSLSISPKFVTALEGASK